MGLSMAEKIRVILGRRKETVTELAERLGTSRQNLSNKLTRDNFTAQELAAIAEALGCTYSSTFTMKDTGETI